jgi:hypothetical protein
MAEHGRVGDWRSKLAMSWLQDSKHYEDGQRGTILGYPKKQLKSTVRWQFSTADARINTSAFISEDLGFMGY